MKTAFISVGRISTLIEERSSQLSNQRRDIEQKLIQESKEFQSELNEIKGQIEDFRETNNQIMKNFQEYCNNIDGLKERLRHMTEKLALINKK